MVDNLMWDQISWSKVAANVQKRQHLIYCASVSGDILLLRFYQKKLLNSKDAKFFAAYRAVKYKVMNKKLQKIDGVDLETSTLQSLLFLVLKPEWEAKIESNCYGFKHGYDINQAVLKTYATLNQDLNYENAIILSGKIDNIFDNLDPTIIIKKSGYRGFFKKYIFNWLSSFNLSNFVQLVNRKFQSEDILTISQQNIAFIVGNILIHGLEDSFLWHLTEKKKLYKYKLNHKRFQVKIISFANHFIIIFSSNNVENIVDSVDFLNSFCVSIQSNFNIDSIKVSSIYESFDFLGFNFQRLKNSQNWNHENTKLLIKPTKKNIKKHLLSIRKCLYHKDRLNRWRANSSMRQYQVITKLNPLINRFADYYHCLIPSFIFRQVDQTINEMIYRYAIKKYKSARYDKWKKNWTKIINGKRVIAYYDEMTQQLKPLNLHYFYKKNKLRTLDRYYFY